jgi:hypothetical protein
MKFFAVHGYWPEAADVVEPIESCFTTHGLKTTVIVERVEPARTETRLLAGAGTPGSGWTTMTLLKSRLERLEKDLRFKEWLSVQRIFDTWTDDELEAYVTQGCLPANRRGRPRLGERRQSCLYIQSL